MSTLRNGGRGRLLLTVLVIAVPWLFRDELAVRLDDRTRAAAEVQTALVEEEQRAAASAEKRETSERLQRIEIMVSQLAKESTKADADAAKNDLFTQAVQDEADELLTSATTLEEHLANLTVSPKPSKLLDEEERKELDAWLGIDSSAGLTQVHLTKLVKKVKDTALAVANADEDEASPAEYEDWPVAATALRAGYAAVSEAARESEESLSMWAGVARLLAWVFTAIGALMIGDWSKLLGGGDRAEDAGKPG